MTKRIHKELITQWANGYVIERLRADGSWREDAIPTWSYTHSYRLKEELGKSLMYQFTDYGDVVFDYQIGEAILNKNPVVVNDGVENSTISRSSLKVIFCVPFQHVKSSNGILSVVRLAQSLESLGVETFFVCVLSEYPNAETLFTDTLRNNLSSEAWEKLFTELNIQAKLLKLNFITDVDSLINDGAIVIYSERIIGNPLGAKRVIRYFGNKDGVLNGGKLVDIQKNDFILCHSKILHEKANHYLYFAEINPEFKKHSAKKIDEREKSVTYVGKGHMYGSVGLFKGTTLITRDSPDNKPELAELLRNSRFLFTWDSWTNLIPEAIYCGVVPILVRCDPFQKEELENFEVPFPTTQLSKIYLDEKENNYKFIDQNDYFSFLQARVSFIQRQNEYEYKYQSSVCNLLEKINKHFDTVMSD